MPTTIPAIFVSSTCYDLRQVRADLKDFIESLGLQPIISDHNSFPVDPDLTAVENCLAVVEERADVFLLIVGGRYGSSHDQGKSVTNMEYLRARAKGVPIYAFIQQTILHILPVWKSNPSGDFSNVVDSPKLFEFVASLMDSSGIWVFPFDVAQQITDTLRKQLAYLFMDALQMRRRVKTAGLSKALQELQGTPLRIVIEKPLAWEYRLFSEVLSYEIDGAKQLRRDLDYQGATGRSQQLDSDGIFTWLSDKSGELIRLMGVANRMVNVALQDALGPSGTPGDAEAIVYVAKKLAAIYRECIEWSIDFQRVEVENEFQQIVRLTSTLTTNMIKEIEDFAENLRIGLNQALSNLPIPGEKRILEFTLTLTAPDTKEFDAEIGRLRAKRGLR